MFSQFYLICGFYRIFVNNTIYFYRFPRRRHRLPSRFIYSMVVSFLYLQRRIGRFICSKNMLKKTSPGYILPGAIKINNHGATRFRAEKLLCANLRFAARITVRLRQSLLALFRFALESPFPRQFPTAIPPPAALCKVQRRGTPLSLRFTNSFYHIFPLLSSLF